MTNAIQDQLGTVTDAIMQITEQIDAVDASSTNLVAMRMQMSIAYSYLVEIRWHLLQGKNLKDALIQAAAGTMPI